MSAFPSDAASWIREVVLTEKMLKAYSPIAVCACQYGLCGACLHGDHKRCMLARRGGAPHVVHEAHITNRSGQVCAATGVSGRVWRSGRPCRWSCPCTTCGAPPAEVSQAAPSDALVDGQLDLFAGPTLVVAA